MSTSKERWQSIKSDPEKHEKVKEYNRARYREMMDNPETRTEILKKSLDYHKKRYATDPEYRKKVIKRTAIYAKRKYAADPEYRKKVRVIQKRWVDKNKAKIKGYRDSSIKRKVCNILTQHGEDMSNDPDHLQTDFIVMLINRDDKKVKTNENM